MSNEELHSALESLAQELEESVRLSTTRADHVRNTRLAMNAKKLVERLGISPVV